jgi:galactoside 2-L-fucosyltransferase 1/2
VAKSGPGRQGNQLFQYASVLGIYEERKRRNQFNDVIHFCIDTGHPFSALEQFFHGPFPACPRDMPQPKHLWERGYGIYTMFDQTQYCSSESCSFTFGPYLQSYKYLQLAGKSIRSALTFSDKDITNNAHNIVSKQVRTNPTTTVVGVHIRREDILVVDYLQEASVEYLDKAMQYFETKFGYNVRFVVVSDDMPWCRAQQVLSNAVLLDTGNAILDLAVLSRCDALILTVGSFGFWGAWLGMAEDVVYNSKAIVLEHPTNRGQIRLEDYYPPMWTGIS